MTAPALRERVTLYFAPLLLLLVAGVQIFRCFAYHQTPWKGGGFGMFATADSQSARFLRCYLIRPEGEERVAVPKMLKRQAVLTRTVPTPDNIFRLAQSLSSSTWVLYDYKFFSMASEILEGLDRPDPAPDHLPSRNAPDPVPSAPEKPLLNLAGIVGPRSSGHHPRFRVKEPAEAPPKVSDVIPFTAIRVELWRYRFDPDTLKILAWKAGEATVPRAAGE